MPIGLSREWVVANDIKLFCENFCICLEASACAEESEHLDGWVGLAKDSGLAMTCETMYKDILSISQPPGKPHLQSTYEAGSQRL